MKNLKIASVTVVTAFLCSSCVSDKKYNEVVLDKTNLQESYNNMQIENERLKTESNSILNENKNLNIENKNLRKDQTLSNEENHTQAIKDLIKEKRQAINNLKKKVNIALEGFTPHEIQINSANGKLYLALSDELLFPAGSDMLNERGEVAIVRLADVIPRDDLNIIVKGHTDRILIPNHRFKNNWDLSLSRASTIARLFIKEGIPTENIVASGENKFQSVSINETTLDQQLNPRTDIVLAPKLDKLWKLTEDSGTASSYRNK